MTQKVIAIPTTVHEAVGRIAQGNYILVRDYTYPCLNKAIQQNKIKLNKNFDSKMMQEHKSKKSNNKKMSLIIMMCLMTSLMLLVIISL